MRAAGVSAREGYALRMARARIEHRRRWAGGAAAVWLCVMLTACGRPADTEVAPMAAALPEAAGATVAASPEASTATAGTGAVPEPRPRPAPTRPEEEVPVTIAVGSAVAEQVEDLIAATERLRGHEFTDEPQILFVAPDEVKRLRRVHLAADLDPVELQPEEALFELLGVLPPGQDLYGFYTEFYSAGTAAYYDLDTAELVVPIEGEVLSPYERWVLVHELTHALMDQTHPAVGDAFETATNGTTDLPDALLGLIEGEAVLIQTQYLREMSDADRQAVFAEASTRGNPAFRAAPAYFQSQLRFPYGDGTDFAVDLFERGGLLALDQAFGNPPSTTEHIYHPDAYVGQEPAIPVTLAAARVASYEVVDSGVWGELGWRSLLGHFLNGATAAQAAAGWGGDRYEVLWNPHTAQAMFVAVIEADSVQDASELAAGLTDIIEGPLGLRPRLIARSSADWIGDDYAALARAGRRLTLVLAHNPSAGRTMAEQLGAIERPAAGGG